MISHINQSHKDFFKLRIIEKEEQRKILFSEDNIGYRYQQSVVNPSKLNLGRPLFIAKF